MDVKTGKNTLLNSKNTKTDTLQTKLAVQYWRSLLFIQPTDYSRVMQIGADCYIADLQTSPTHKATKMAREAIIYADQKGYFANLNLVVKLNALANEKELQADIASMVGLTSVMGFLVTMAASAQDIQKLDKLISTEEKRKGLAQGTYKFIIHIETPSAIFNALEIAKAGGGRNIAMLLGSNDLFHLTKAESTVKLTLDFIRNDVVLACRAAGIEPFDTVFGSRGDKIGLEWSSISGKKHGFTGKAALYPENIKTIKRIFNPEPRKVELAKKILERYEQSKTNSDNADIGFNGGNKSFHYADLIRQEDENMPAEVKDALILLDRARVLLPQAKKGVRGVVAKHIVNTKLQPGGLVPNPFEITITESFLGLWQAAFYSHDRTVTSQLYAAKLGLTTGGHLTVPFMMVLNLTVCMSETHGALMHLGFRNARQHAAIHTGMTVKQKIVIKDVRPTSNNKNTIVTSRRELVNLANKQVLFSIDKIELYPPLSFSFSENGKSNFLDNFRAESTSAFKAGILSKCYKHSELLPDKNNILPLNTGDLILHTFARPMGIDTNLALSTWFKVTLPIHLDYHLYEENDLKNVLVSGGLVESLTLSAVARDFHEVIWEEMIHSDSIAPVRPTDTLGAVSYILDRKVSPHPIKHEEITVRTYGLKNISPAVDCLNLDFPIELFDVVHKKPAEYEKILEEAGAYWLEGKLASVVTRKIVRLIVD